MASNWYEGFPRTIVEAFSVGTPILSSKIGNMSTIIEEDKTGKFFIVDDSEDLKKKALWMINHKQECIDMGKNAYKEYLDKYISDKNYELLMNIYGEVLKPKVLIIHNKYRLHGGEDSMFESEKKLLETKGHKVITYVRNNKETTRYGSIKTLLFPLNTIFSLRTYFKIKKLIKKEKPDVAYIHNTFPVISPSVYYACRSRNVPTIQRLPNYRLLCPNAYLFRAGKVCELCLAKNNPFIGVKYKCYRKSKTLTFILALMLKIHRRTYLKKVDMFVPNSEIVRSKFIQAGYPKNKLIYKPNFTDGMIEPNFKKKEFAIYVGRLSIEKGVNALAQAWADIDYPLEIYGTGPLLNIFAGNPNIKCFNEKSMNECINRIKNAKFLIFSSEWEETFGISMIEAFSVGTPVLASKIGNMKYVVEDGKTGKFFIPGDATDLKKKALWMIEHSKECIDMGKLAYKEYKEKYTPEINYNNLMNVFEKVINDAKTK
jgi:glycosyltransferase involved in cell wall biosynthesis